jgi:hypothetical protein
LALGTAVFALNRLWREQESEALTGGWLVRWRDFMHGSREKSRRVGRLWLEANPFVWLAGRDRQPAVLGWLVVGGIVLVWLLCLAAWPAQWPGTQNFFITAILLNALMAWLTRHAAAQGIAKARRDGAYELLLTTPLNPSDIVRGVLETVRLHFRALANFLVLLNVLMMLGGLTMRRWNAGALIEYFVIWSFLLTWTWSLGHWMSRLLPVMWASLNCGRPAHAVLRTSGFNSWSWIWIVFNAQFYSRGFRRFPTGSPGEIVFVCFIALVCVIIWAAIHHSGGSARVRELKWDPEAQVWLASQSTVCETRLIREFREIVREPLPDPSDPRFKRWNVAERFPWGWGLIQQQLHERLARK